MTFAALRSSASVILSTAINNPAIPSIRRYGSPRTCSRNSKRSWATRRCGAPPRSWGRGFRRCHVSLTARVPAEIPLRLLRVSTERKISKVRPCTQQEIVAEALMEWLDGHNY